MHTVACPKCGKEIQRTYNICPFCNYNLELNSGTTFHDTTQRVKKSNKYLIYILLIILISLGYFSYQWYQSKQYLDKIMPLYRNFAALAQDQDSIINNGGKYVDLIDGMKKNSASCKDLRMKLVQIEPPDSKSNNIHKTFNDSIDKLASRGQAMTNALQADLRYKVSNKTFYSLLDMGASHNALDRENKESEKAGKESEKADGIVAVATDDFKLSKDQLDKLLNIK